MYKRFFKRILDFFFALILLVLLFPIFIGIICFLFISNRGRPFFLQKRPGKNEKKFNVLKFKTLNDEKDAEGHLLPDHMRITQIGGFIRKTSLDELPQLINIVKGEMSFIGPRPYFSISQILTFPGYREGFPNVLMQSEAMGLTSVVSDINGCNEIITNGFNGEISQLRVQKHYLKAWRS